MSIEIKKVYRLRIKEQTLELSPDEVNELYAQLSKILGKWEAVKPISRPYIRSRRGLREQEILEVIKANNGITVKDLSEKVGLELSVVYRYVRLLEERGAIYSRKVGRASLWFAVERKEEPSESVAVIDKRTKEKLNTGYKVMKELDKMRRDW